MPHDLPPADSSRLIAGCMSGTSLDGIDVAIVRVSGTGRSMVVDVVGSGARNWPEETRAELLHLADPVNGIPKRGQDRVDDLDVRLAGIYANVISGVCTDAGLDVTELDAVGNHGQTVFHDPVAGVTLQLGDPERLATLLGIPVVGDFRSEDVALGGQGAPLVPYMDWALFTDNHEHRLLLNLGGIANVTSLPPDTPSQNVIAFDTGPANMMVDALAMRLLDRPFDTEGAVASEGLVDEAVLDVLMRHAYFSQPPPKSTGRELFGADMVEQFLASTHHLDTSGKLANAAAWTARSVAEAISAHIPGTPDVMWVSGGGVHNRAIMQGLRDRLPGIRVDSLASSGYDPDSKEAVCFALLAHERLNGVATGMPSVTGARDRAFSGKICLPGTTD